MGKGAVSLAKFLCIFTADHKLRLTILHLTNIDDMVTATQQQIYLYTGPFGTIDVGLFW